MASWFFSCSLLISCIEAVGNSVAASRAANRRDGCEAYEQQFHELDSDIHLIYQSNPTQPNP